MGEWDSPEDLQSGDTIEYCYDGIPVPGRYHVYLRWGTDNRCVTAIDDFGRTIHFSIIDSHYAWKRVEVETLPTIQIPAAAEALPIAYGATCKRCNTFNEYAEAKTGYTCYSCRL